MKKDYYIILRLATNSEFSEEDFAVVRCESCIRLDSSMVLIDDHIQLTFNETSVINVQLTEP